MLNIDQLSLAPKHVVAICGGAVSGSEAALVCAELGMLVIVLEQNTRPYGKIEDGLPRWHDKLRAQEYARIDESLAHHNVLFVPRTQVGRDIQLAALSGMSVVFLANGAWRDRPLPVPGAEAFAGRGLVYQNSFVHWFNHCEDPDYDGPRYQVEDNALVVGGGLASVDVVKIINLMLYQGALRARGIEVAMVELEHAGIPRTLAEHGLDVAALGIAGATLYYRRRVRDMPVATPRDDSPEQLAKTEHVREKLVQVLTQKYCVRVVDCHAPVGLVVEGDRLVGLRFSYIPAKQPSALRVDDHTPAKQPSALRVDDPVATEREVRAPLIISSIGSVPESISGIPTKGELYDYANWSRGAVAGLPGVYGLGNVLTGKGNIKDSRQNAREIATLVGTEVMQQPQLAPAQIRALVERVQARWAEVGYDGDYRAWLAAHPVH